MERKPDTAATAIPTRAGPRGMPSSPASTTSFRSSSPAARMAGSPRIKE